MALSKEDREKLRERIKGLTKDEREAVVEALDIKPDASVADMLKSIETLQQEVKALRESKQSVTILEKIFGG